jgi:hypothetical protein
MNKLKMPLVVKFLGNSFYTSSAQEPNFKTIFLVDDYFDSCIVNLVDKNNNPIYLSYLQYILHTKRLDLNPGISPDDFWELGE